MFDAGLNEHQARVDKLQLVALCGLMLLGAAFVYSATTVGAAADSLVWYNEMWFRQIVWYSIGLCAAGALCLVDYRVLARWSYVIYWITIFLLLLVLIPHVGSVRFNARRWFDLRFFQLQPSEFAKLAFILALAHSLSRPVDEVRTPAIFWKSLGLMLLPFA